LSTLKTSNSRCSTQIELREGRILYTDLGSSNGTLHNGADLKEHVPVELASGDALLLGDTLLLVNVAVQGSP
jgi:pSer/pThr/pTyr-binding forkhead associated (FHA) protein